MTGAPLTGSMFPSSLNLGSGKDFRADFFNLDVDDTWAPDAVCDLSAIDNLAQGVSLKTTRFGDIVLRPGCFEKIIANDVLEHVPDLMKMMTTCLALLRVGGVFQISVPYDLSYGAWQDPTHVRAFNERSWLYYTDWFWYMGWSEARFVLDSFEFVPSPLGKELRSRDVARDEILRTPRAVDSMSVTLKKVELSAADRATWEHWRERKRQAQERKLAMQAAAAASTTRMVASPAPAAIKAFDGPFDAHRDRYCIWIVTPQGYSHQQAYEEVAFGLGAAFAELGGSAPIIQDPTQAEGRTLIVLGPQLLPPSAATLLPADSILYNLEQVQEDSPWMQGHYMALLRQRPVLDFSVRNHAALVRSGVAHARLLPIGFVPGLSRITPAAEKDVDVLFYGSRNERRGVILDQLAARGLKVAHLFNIYGAERDAAIARAKIVLNMHFYEAAIFESVRVSYLLANGACVVTEGVADDPDLAPFATGLAIERHEDLVARCIDLLADEGARAALAQAGFEVVRKHRQADLLASLFTPS